MPKRLASMIRSHAQVESMFALHAKRKILNWTPLAWLNSQSHHTGFSTSEGFNKEKVTQP